MMDSTAVAADASSTHCLTQSATASLHLAGCRCNRHRRNQPLLTLLFESGSQPSSTSRGKTKMTDSPEAILEAAALLVDWDKLPSSDLSGNDYTAWLGEWESRMANLRRTVKAYRGF